MRRTVLALLSVAALAAACQPPAETPAAQSADAAAPAPEMPANAPPQEEVDPTVLAAAPAGEPGSCLGEVGAAASARLVERCIAVSPATHPPCNAANPCEMIQGEIDRACEMYGPGEAKPAECGA
ncbi:hypothetical protein [Brevundimonas sp.]|uniref:hypothetical protein n=1 Tax=Brevundimonas sp. TaxID=1871086 RepID=UPI002D2295B9|nr:hypothetical protein [Brevundimonas sp.]HYC68146.1 hypothetical protein [Brevundimonas sp.]